MGPDYGLIMQPGLFNTENLVDCSGNSPHERRMIMMYRWLLILLPDLPLYETIIIRQSKADLDDDRKNGTSWRLNPTTPGPACLSGKIPPHPLAELRKTDNERTGDER